MVVHFVSSLFNTSCRWEFCHVYTNAFHPFKEWMEPVDPSRPYISLFTTWAGILSRVDFILKKKREEGIMMLKTWRNIWFLHKMSWYSTAGSQKAALWEVTNTQRYQYNNASCEYPDHQLIMNLSIVANIKGDPMYSWYFSLLDLSRCRNAD